MRSLLVLLALLFGAGPALAQASSLGNPNPAAPEAEPVKHHHAAHKPAAGKARHDARKAEDAATAKKAALPAPTPKRSSSRRAAARSLSPLTVH